MAPALIDYDPVLYAIVMELLPRHKILRLALIDGERHEQAVRMVADYAARATFHTSVLARPFEAVFDRMALYARNLPLTRITVDLVFTEPYIEHPRNRWTSPQLDDSVAALRHDVALKRAAARLGHAFLTRHEALLHGDLHTGSVMVARQDGGGATADDTRVIDPEFALYGPIGFDLGAFVANLLMAYLAQPGLATQPGARANQAEWVLTQVGVFWRHFAARFEALWIASSATPGADAYPATLFTSPDGRAAMAAERARTLNAILVDLVGFAGIEIIRRTVGFAHNRDFEAITDPDRRADAERRALRLARRLLVEPEAFDDIGDVEQAAREIAQAASD
jgi:5-methylthioribose kinase